MYPILLEFGQFSIKSFGLMAAIGFLLAYLVLTRTSMKIAKIPPIDISQFLVIVMLGGAFGARFAYVAEHWTKEFAGMPFWEIFRFDKGGLMFYGGLGGAIIAIALYSHIKRKSLISLLDMSAVALPLGHAFGRIGCFLNGCCYGRVTDSPVGLCYPTGSNPWYDQINAGLITQAAGKSLPVIPSQLVEAILNIILFIVLFKLAKKERPLGLYSGIYLISYAFIRAFTETLRADPRMTVGALSIAQFICIFVFLAGIAFLLYSRLGKKVQ